MKTSSRLTIVSRLTDDQLIAQVSQLARHEREITVDLVAHLAELDRRKLYLDRGCDSLFAYCVEVLQLSEPATYKRIAAARAVLECPEVLELMASAELNLTTVGILRPLLQSPNYAEILAAARFKSKREVELLVANLRPQADVRSSIRKVSTPMTTAEPTGDDAPATNGSGTEPAAGTDLPLLASPAGPEPSSASAPEPSASSAAVPASPRPVIAPLGNERYKYQFMVSSETHAKFLRAQALLRHAISDGDPAAIFDRALDLLVVKLEKTRLAATDKPRLKKTPTSSATSTDNPTLAANVANGTEGADATAPNGRPSTVGDPSRHIPADLVRQVYDRDGHRCTKTSVDGKRCTRTDRLQIDHIVPWATGGETRLENLRLLCRAHNLHAAEQYYGTALVERRIDEERQRRKKRQDERRSNEAERRSHDEASGDSIVSEAGALWTCHVFRAETFSERSRGNA